MNNFFTITFRNLRKNKTYNFLNISGLAIGVACAGLILLWVEDEMNYDQVHTKKDVLYHIRTNQTYDGVTRTFGSTPGPLADAIKAEMPGIANTCRIQRGTMLFSVGEKSIMERGAFADTSVFSMFGQPFIQGSPLHALKEMASVVITDKMAARFFGEGVPVIGKTIKADNKDEYLITGVVKSPPPNTTLQADWYIPFAVNIKNRPFLVDNWNAYATNTYAELVPGTDAVAINRKIFDFLEKKDPGATARPFLFAMNDWRLRDKFEGGKQVGGQIEYVRMFTMIAWIILLIACVNFMNLATARSEKRAREVGVRKVIGAGRSSLIFRFIGEAMCMSFIAVIIGGAIVYIALPAFNTVVEKQLVLGLDNPLHLGVLCMIGILCGLVAGSYPAFYLSGFRPVQVLKGLQLKAGAATWIRKGLVVTQFSVSLILIIGTMIIYQQIQHVKGRELGYDKNNLVSIQARGDLVKNFTAIRQDLINTGLIENAGLNSFNTVNVGNNTSRFQWQGKDKNSNPLVSQRQVSPELIPTLGIQLLEGRQFGSNIDADSSHVIISQSLAKMMGSGSAIGKKLFDDYNSFTVVGVVNDFVYGDMYGQSDPVMYFSEPRGGFAMYVRIKAGAEKSSALAKMESVLKKHNPAYPFEYAFVDDQFNDKFKSENLMGRLSRLFALLAILISCLGLFGLAAYTAERRTKEIGIRRVLGASVAGITGLLSKDFLQLVLISMLIAFPTAWWVMNNWLQGYAYRISISWWIFPVAGAGALLIALLTVSVQSVKAAIAKPVRSLRAE